jgi:hypothetical protein
MDIGVAASINIFALVDDIKEELGVEGNPKYDGIVFKLIADTGIHLDSIEIYK